MADQSFEETTNGAERLARPFVHVLDEELRIIDEIRRRRRRPVHDPHHNGHVPPGDTTSASGPIDMAHRHQLVGLAFSGGGIRSATFNLGVLQGLAQLKLLDRFDYLSTVSGGGYIGGWLTSWILRSHEAACQEEGFEEVRNRRGPRPGIDQVTRRLHPDRLEQIRQRTAGGSSGSCESCARPLSGNVEDPAGESSEVRFLREYSNYLTPKLGWFGADTWTMVAIYIRNLLLNLLVLFTSLSVIILITNFFGLILSAFQHASTQPHPVTALWWEVGVPFNPILHIAAIAGAFVAVLVSSLMIGTNLGIFARNGYHESSFPSYTRQGSMQRFVVLPLFIAAFLCSCFLWGTAGELPILFWIVTGAAVHTTMSVIAWLASGRLVLWYRSDRQAPAAGGINEMPWLSALLVTPIAGATGGMLVFGVLRIIEGWGQWQVVTWGPPLFVAAFTLMMIFHIGLAGRRMPDNIREWWSRLLAWLLIYTVGWAVLFSFPTYGPPVLLWMAGNERTILAFITTLWSGLTAAGIIAGRKSSPETRKGKRGSLELVAKIAPYVFIVGLLAGLSLGVHTVLFHFYPEIGAIGVNDRSFETIMHDYWRRLNQLGWNIWIPFVLALGVALALAWRIDVNQFSMHLFYRNRLVRCFLGASNRGRRGPQPFTGFDPQDDIPLSEIVIPATAAGEGARARAGRSYDGPYPIINAALNLVGGEELAWQQRKATSFIFTPRFSGYLVTHRPRKGEQKGVQSTWLDHVGEWRKDLVGVRNGRSPLERAGYRRTSWYAFAKRRGLRRDSYGNIDGGGISLGTAMAISGAAASPNMGYHSSAALAFLMTIFNIRLGWWIGNPRHRTGWQSSGPSMLSSHLLVELFGLTNDAHSHVYLSDGGHFENLGLYELVRRRCRLIVASDAAQDGSFEFNDLGNAIEKCRADLGIDIDIRVEPIRMRDENGHSRWHCAVGTIRYDKVDAGAQVGTLLYLKASITGDEPTDVLRYAAQNGEFPHQSTADQWFNESQFESYRMLGLHSILEALKGVAHNDIFEDMTTEAIAVNLHQRWLSPSRRASGSHANLSRTLDDIYERLRNDRQLRFLDAQIYPAWGNLNEGTREAGSRPALMNLPKDPELIRRGFYLCSQIIQLMEDVYLDLNLDEQFEHPDNRGWVNLFRHWSWSGMFRATWAVTASTYGARFQRFCERRLHLKMGDIGLGPAIKLHGKQKGETHDLLEQATLEGRLNMREKSIIGAFCRAHPVDRVVPLVMVLDIGLAEGEGTHTGRGADTTTISFPVGFALIHQNAIVYFRIQDHLRGMGMARMGLQRLQDHYRDKALLTFTVKRFKYRGKELPTKRNEERFARLFRSTCYDNPDEKRERVGEME